MRLQVDAPAEIWLKLENLQPIGSFKIRGAVNAIRQAPRELTAAGVVTASAGNMAQGVAWAARELGVPATIVVPVGAPQTKLAAIGFRYTGRPRRAPAPSATTRARSASSRTAAAVSSRVTVNEPASRGRARSHITGSSARLPAPSTNEGV